MGRNYAGVLGPLAFFTIVMRGLVHGSRIDSTLLSAAVHLFLFAAVGYVVGELAGWIILDSVRAKVTAELAAKTPTATGTGK